MYKYIYIYIYMYTYMCKHVYTYIYIYIHIHTHTYRYVYIYIYIYTQFTYKRKEPYSSARPSLGSRPGGIALRTGARLGEGDGERHAARDACARVQIWRKWRRPLGTSNS